LATPRDGSQETLPTILSSLRYVFEEHALFKKLSQEKLIIVYQQAIVVSSRDKCSFRDDEIEETSLVFH